MRFLIPLFMLACSIGYGQRISVGPQSYALKDIKSVTLDSIMPTYDGTGSYYVNAIVSTRKEVKITELDSTVYQTSIDTIPYLVSSELASGVFNSIVNGLYPFAESHYNIFYQDSTFANLSMFNSVLITLTGQGFFATTSDRWTQDYVGYWRMRYYNGTWNTRYFYIQPDGNIIQIEDKGNNTVGPVVGGWDGTLRVYSPRTINLRNLVVGATDLLLHSSATDFTKFVATEVDFLDSATPFVVQLTYASQWQDKTYVP